MRAHDLEPLAVALAEIEAAAVQHHADQMALIDLQRHRDRVCEAPPAVVVGKDRGRLNSLRLSESEIRRVNRPPARPW